MISSPHNPTVRKVSRLRKPIRREQEGAFLVEGHQAVSVALAVRAPLMEMLHTPAAKRRRGALLKEASDAGAKVIEVSEEVLDYVTSSPHPVDVLATAAIRRAPLERALGGDLVVVLAGVRDPSVAGGILASAVAAGASAAVALRGTADLFAQACVRAACGAHFVLDLATRADPAEVAAGLAGRRAVVLDEEGTPLPAAGLRRPLALVVPGEGGLLPGAFAGAERIRVPGGVAGVRAGIGARAAVVLYEVTRTEP